MATIVSSGTQTAVVTTEHTLATITTAGVYKALIDFENHANGDETEIRWYSKVLNAGSEKVTGPILGVADDLGSTPVVVTQEIVCPSGGQIHVTLKQTAGSARNFDWAIQKIDDVDISADAVDDIWDEPTSGHATAGTTGKALTDAQSAGDPWATALPGAYTSGQAGKIVGDNINATISSRLASADITLSSGTVTLSSSERNSIATALLDLTDGVETSITMRKLLRGLSAFLLGKGSGGGTTTVRFRNFNDSKYVITYTLSDTETNDRTAVSTDLT